ncbi:MalY/PatB family protein [Sideroxydans lithotrophicus]|uniref:cysteine-S-conjugate beta-lyase n=1 Tax=Sideroxydans lithotrophicus (strain ES-1) TaxID=580332 RepID=D5CSS6_SIDLE|nr:pyridoxal phosphate-dependent aminotransferase [Sideroxydans lithotrophicus]ADE12012.1 aminotransferase class I and II [Sideroxydans lithotrophicus ES-1]
MPSEFDQIISRAGTSSLKYDARYEYFARADVLPMWVADMDFAVPAAVQQALANRAAHPVFGYTVFPESLYDALIHWLHVRHSWTVQRESILCCPGVVPTLHACIFALTRPGDAVIVQPPVYAPFLSAPATTGRKLLLNPLKLEEGRYRFDLDDLERCAAEGGRLLILCSPHNPVGRVWQRQELQALLEVCQRHGIAVVSDEIHADLVYPGVRHVPLATLPGQARIVTAVAPSKTFNIPGLGLSALIVADEADRAAITKAFDTLHVSASNPFSIVAFEAAYRDGAPWLDELLDYLAGTRDLVRDFLQQHLPRIRLIEPEGTYLLWLDCRAMGLSDKQLKHFFVQEAGLGLSPGVLFGEQGSGFMRMNIGAPRSVVKQALENIARAEQTLK